MPLPTRTAFPFALAVLMTAAGCGEGPSPVPVSETELWTLVMYQTNEIDPDNPNNSAPRRGMMYVRLRLNQTSQPDPACTGNGRPDITTVLATAEAIDSRLQPGSAGSFDGSWNCHGLAATLRLDDGTRYELRGTNRSGFFGALDSASTWRSGARHGFFSLKEDDHATPVRDSHVGVLVRNRGSRPWRVQYLDNGYFSIGGIRLLHGGNFIAPGSSMEFSWPALAWTDVGSSEWPEIRRFGRYEGVSFFPGATFACVLGAGHPRRVEILLDVLVECGDGWLGEATISAPDLIFLKPGQVDTIAFHVTGRIATTWARTTTPDVTVLRVIGDRLAIVAVAPDAPLVDYGITIWARNTDSGDSVAAYLTASVYDLDATILPDTVVVTRGQEASAEIRLERRGVTARSTAVAIDLAGAERWFSRWRLEPTPTMDSVVTLTFETRADLTPGRYGASLCAHLVPDPKPNCSPINFRMMAPEPTEPPRIPTTIAQVSVHNQVERVVTNARVVPAVLVSDSAGRGVPGVPVFFRAAQGTINLGGAGTPVTDSAGIAAPVGWLLGLRPGVQSVIVTTVPNSGILPDSIIIPVTVLADLPNVIEVVEGDNQMRGVGTPVAIRPRVVVRDKWGNPVGGVPVRFVVEAGGGVITGGNQITDANGQAAVGSWTLGPAAGPNLLVAEVPRPTGASMTVSDVSFTATGVAGLQAPPDDGTSEATGAEHQPHRIDPTPSSLNRSSRPPRI